MTSRSYAQLPFYHYFEDTIRPGYRISGSFDSIDAKLGIYQSALPTSWRPALETFDLSRMYVSAPLTVKPMRFSSIAHVGLQYSFGSNVSQQGGIAYTQALTKNQFVQMDYLRQNSNGAIRNSAYERNHFELAHLVRKQRYASQATLLFEGNVNGANGGLVNDSVDESLPIEFSDVEKPDGLLTQHEFVADWKNFFSFTKDSLVKTGIYLAPHYRISDRRFHETGDINALYGLVQYDSIETNDFWQRSEIGGTAGYFFQTQPFAVNAGFRTAYWDYDNLVRKSDTTELSITGDLVVHLLRTMQLNASGAYTFVGAAGEKSLSARLSYAPEFASVNVKFLFNQKFPLNYQRAYYGNAIEYTWQEKTLITTTKLEAVIVSKKRYLPLRAGIAFTNVLNSPFFVDNTWRQDTLSNLSFLSLHARADLKWKKLFFQPFVRWQQSNFAYVPELQLMARIGFDGFLFKARKLRATIGFDAGYTSSFQLLDYVPMMDTYVLPGALRNYEAMPKLHVFTQFELGFFRWYIRVENIEQAFWEPVNQEALGYPVVPLQLRIGLSWDLFN